MTSDTLVTARTFPGVAARELYDAFADPARLAQWWGPHGTSTETHSFDLRPGGAWRLTMRGPWGEAAMAKTFEAVEPGRRVLVRHTQDGHTFTLDMRLDDVPGGARATWTTRFATQAQLDAVREAFARGNEENLERLARHLAGRDPSVRAGAGP